MPYQNCKQFPFYLNIFLGRQMHGCKSFDNNLKSHFLRRKFNKTWHETDADTLSRTTKTGIRHDVSKVAFVVLSIIYYVETAIVKSEGSFVSWRQEQD